MKYTLFVVIMLVFATLACNLSSSDPEPTPLSINQPPASNSGNTGGLPQEGSGDNASNTGTNTNTGTNANTGNTGNTSNGSTGTNTGSNTNTGTTGGTTGGSTTTCLPRTDWTVFYTVQSGDTLGDLANRTSSTTTALAQGNCLANPNMLSVGQTLRVPRQPSPRTSAPTIGQMTFLGGSMSGTTVTVSANQRYTLSVTVSGATSVNFYYAPTGTGVTPFLIGSDSNLADGASVGWNTPNGEVSVNVWAEALNAAGQRATSALYLVQVLGGGGGPAIGGLVFAPTNYEDGLNIGVPSGGRITIMATAVMNAARVNFYVQDVANGLSPVLIGSDTNLSDGASIVWDAPQHGLGTLRIYAESATVGDARAASPYYNVSWGPSCQHGWFFSFTNGTSNLPCPLAAAVGGSATAQDFEGGRAFDYPIPATTGNRYIFVLYNDGSYEYYVREYNSNLPLDNSDLTVPSNRYAPEGAIGYLWKTNEGVRNRLGWAYSPLESFNGRWQFPDGGAESATFPPLFPGWTIYIDYGKNGLVLQLTELSAGNGGRRWVTVGSY